MTSNPNWSYMSDLDAFELYHIINESNDYSSPSSQFAALFQSALREAARGAVGTSISNLILYPLDLVVTRLKVQQRLQKTSSSSTSPASSPAQDDSHYDGIPDAFVKIYTNEGGLPAFYSGLVEDTLKSMLDSFFLFLFYTLLRRARRNSLSSSSSSSGASHHKRNAALQVLDELAIGVVAGAATKALTAPIQSIVTRKQIAAVASARKSPDHHPKQLGRKTSALDMAAQIYRTKGLRGFYSGYSATLLLTLNPSLTFFSEAALQRVFVKKGGEASFAATFMMAATAKAVASTVTFPLSMAKARAQAAASAPTEEEDEAGKMAEKEAGGTGKQRSDQGGQEKMQAQKGKGKPANIFVSLAQIAQTEGVSALYSGVGGEVLKGFFSHGLTILLKERLFATIIGLYYAVASRLRQRRV